MVEKTEIEEMRLHLLSEIALRRLGEYEIERCPYCKEPHSHGGAPGHRVAHCDHPYPDLRLLLVIGVFTLRMDTPSTITIRRMYTHTHYWIIRLKLEIGFAIEQTVLRIFLNEYWWWSLETNRPSVVEFGLLAFRYNGHNFITR